MDNRAEVWSIGFGLGCCAVAGLLLAATLRGLAFSWAWLNIGASVFIICWLGLPFLVWLLTSGWGVFWAIRQTRDDWANRHAQPDDDDEPPAAPETPAAAERVIDIAERRRLQEIAHWQVFFRRLGAAGFAYGWDQRTLTGKGLPTRVTSQGGWNQGTDQLVLARLIVKDQTGTRALVTEKAWTDGRLWEAVPCPAGEPPDIVPPPYSRQYATNETPANHAIITAGQVGGEGVG